MKKKISEQKRKLRYRNAMKKRRSKERRKKIRINQENYIRKKKKKYALNKKRLNFLNGEYVSLEIKDIKLLRNKNFLNSQNYISSNKKDFRLFYYSKEKINGYKKSKILINKIKKDFFEKTYIKYLNFIGKNKSVKGYRVYI